MKRHAAAWAAVLILAAAVRLPSVWAAAPYHAYVDEARLLQRVVQLLHAGGWHPRWYLYPSLPIQGIAAAVRLYQPIYWLAHGAPLRDELSPWPPRHLDVVEPAELVLVARAVTLLVGLAIVLLTGRLAALLAGEAAGVLAALLAAVVPALVIRGAVVTVDPWAAMWSTAAILCGERMLRSPPSAQRSPAQRSPARWALAAGGACGLALCSKYPAVLVAAVVVLALWRLPPERRVRAQCMLAAAAGGAAAALVSMPAFLVDRSRLLVDLLRQAHAYEQLVIGSYWRQALLRAEWDHPLASPELGAPLLACALVGLLTGLRERRWRPTMAAWSAYIAASLLLFSRYQFRAFRSLLPLVPLVCVLAALAVIALGERLRRPRLVASAGTVAALVLLLPASWGYARERAAYRDARSEAVQWLRGVTARRVLVVEELGILRGELDRLPFPREVLPLERATSRLRARPRRFDLVVTPELGARGRDLADLVAGPGGRFTLVAAFGEVPFDDRRLWRGNR